MIFYDKFNLINRRHNIYLKIKFKILVLKFKEKFIKIFIFIYKIKKWQIIKTIFSLNLVFVNML